MDLLRPEQFLKLKKRLSEQYGFNEDKILGVSVPKSVGVAELLLKIKETLPEGPMYYAEDDLTDRNLRFLCAELIREKIFLFTKEEIPYSTAVQITKYEEKSALHRIFADIYVEKDTQKGIIVGSNGSMIKKIGSAARKDIEELVDSKVYLELFVKVKKDWTKDKEFLKELGYK